MRRTFGLAVIAVVGFALGDVRAGGPPPGFVSLFNGRDFTGWKVPMGDNGHWKVVNGVIDYDAKSEAKGERSLFTEKNFKDFTLLIDWKCKLEPAFKNKNVPIILPSGEHLKDESGKEVRIEIDDVDSGIYIRGQPSAQVNIWMWPIGSGEVYGYRMNKKHPPEVRAGVTPKKRMDKPRGEWNTFEITVKGDRLWVKLNGEEVISNAHLPGLVAEGPLALQHHGGWNVKTNQWSGPPSIVQFRNIYIKDLSAPVAASQPQAKADRKQVPQAAPAPQDQTQAGSNGRRSFRIVAGARDVIQSLRPSWRR